jgi:hypothetical protein
MAGWNDERRGRGVDEPIPQGDDKAPDVPRWLQWVLALTALGLGAWFGWVMF